MRERVVEDDSHAWCLAAEPAAASLKARHACRRSSGAAGRWLVHLRRGSSKLSVQNFMSLHLLCVFLWVQLQPFLLLLRGGAHAPNAEDWVSTTPGLFLFVCFSFFIFIYLFIYIFLAVLGLRCRARAFSGCGERGLPFLTVRGLLIVVASLVVEHGL